MISIKLLIQNKKNIISYSEQLEEKKKKLDNTNQIHIQEEKNTFVSKKYLSFEEAKSFVKLLDLNSEEEWEKYCNNEIEGFKEIPSYIPKNPKYEYHEYWIDWNDWLGKIEKIDLNKIDKLLF